MPSQGAHYILGAHLERIATTGAAARRGHVPRGVRGPFPDGLDLEFHVRGIPAPHDPEIGRKSKDRCRLPPEDHRRLRLFRQRRTRTGTRARPTPRWRQGQPVAAQEHRQGQPTA